MRETYTRKYSCFPRSLFDRIILCIYHLPFFCLSVSHTPMLPVEEAELMGHEAQAHGDVPDRYSLTVYICSVCTSVFVFICASCAFAHQVVCICARGICIHT